MNRTITFILVLVCYSIISCMSVGKNFSQDTQWIAIGKTTQTQITERLGTPQELGVRNGTPFWNYYYIQFSLWKKISRKELQIFWKKDLTVHSYSLTKSPISDKQLYLQPSKTLQKTKGPASEGPTKP